ncbi:MAG TPA: hypothetical protein VJZ17_01830 [Nitrosopumilaceae archaeon]|nr:hypothetical protein [Nitrosopumilaceae archaeon]
MITKSGIVITVTILGAITAASFAVWFIPQNNDSGFVVSDFQSHLESIEARHDVIAEEIESDLENMIGGTVLPDDFILKAEASSSQINSLIIEVVKSGAPQEWQESYLNYDESLKRYNDYLREAITLANKMRGDISDTELQQSLERLDGIKKESESFALKSNEMKP